MSISAVVFQDLQVMFYALLTVFINGKVMNVVLYGEGYKDLFTEVI